MSPDVNAPTDGPGTPSSLGFAPIARNERLSDKVAQRLLESIESDQLTPGSRFPSERELGEQFGVSRTVIREAVRSLTAKGVLEVRPGSGVHVATVAASSVSDQMALFLRARGSIDYATINEVRLALEVRTAELAAERATDDDIRELRARCQRMAALEDDVEGASVEDVEFHRAIARATQNELFTVMLDSIGPVLIDVRRSTLGMPGRVREAVGFHERILARVAAHDVQGAAQAMREHLDESDAAWRSANVPAADADAR